MKLHWLIPLTVDTAFQFTSKNELARSFKQLGNEISTTVAYVDNKIPMDGFSRIEYCHTPRGSTFKKLHFHWRQLRSALCNDVDVVMFGFAAMHLVPIARLLSIGRSRPKYIMDIRTVPVDVGEDLNARIDLLRYDMAIKLADWFCDGITVITPTLGDTVRPKLSRLKDRMGVWTSGVHLEHFERDGSDRRVELGLSGKQVLLYHGVLSPNRGLQNALRALHLLRDEFPDLVFLFVGEGAGRLELEQLSDELGLGERVIFTGKVPYQHVPEFIRTADLAILPFPNITWWAVSSPIKLMEYLAIGVPIVATDIAAHRWVIEQTGGAILAEDDQPLSLAKSIREILANGVPMADRKVLDNTISWDQQALNLNRFADSLM